MDLNPICHPSRATKIKCWFIDYVQLLMMGWAGQWTRTPSVTPLQPKNKILIFGLRSTSDDRSDWLMDLNPICHPTPVKKWNSHFWITFNFWRSAGLVVELEPHLPPLSSQKNKMFIIALHSTSDDRLGWSMDSNLICHPSPAKKIKCSFLDYVQLLMIGRAGQRTQILSATPLQPKNKMLIFGLCSTSDDWPGWSMDSKPVCHPSPVKKIKSSFLDYV